jgi:hypothetical protein
MLPFISGLIRTEEDRQWMKDNAAHIFAAGPTIDHPEEFDPRGIIRTENQSRLSSCVGHGFSTAGEGCAWIDSGGELKIQFSRWGTYIWAQQASGMGGRDNGAQISGGVKACSQWGYCPEELWPYPDHYTMNEPAGAKEAAAPYGVQNHVVIKGYDDGLQFMQNGKGVIVVGVDWMPGLANNKGDVTVADVRNGRSMGGHCMAVWGWTKDGRVPLINSHGTQWGNQGFRNMVPEAFDYWCKNAEVYGITDLRDVNVTRPVIADAGEGM